MIVMNKKVVGVTGAGGRIGKVVVEKLIKMGFFVKKDRIEVGNLDEVKEFVKGCDYVIHLAVEMNNSKSEDIFTRTNINGVSNILKCLNNNIKAVMVSSVVVYQETGTSLKDETWKIREAKTGNLYVDTKVEGLKIIRESKNKVVTVMPSIVLDKSSLFNHKVSLGSDVLNWIFENIGGGIPGGIMAAIGDKNRIINFVEVNDVADGIILAMEKGVVGEEYILSGQNITTLNYLKRMSKIMGKRYLKIRIPFWIITMANIIFPNIHVLVPENMGFSSDKAKSNLSYNPLWQI
jgi:nucleoside-diphosphate-sugar epimerase